MTTANDSIQCQIAWIDARSEYQSQEASIINLTSRSVTVSTPETVPLQQQCAITILGEGGQVLFAAQATTQTLCNYDLARHTTCQWCNRIEDDALMLLANLGFYNRRKGNRKRVAITAPARQELSSGELLPVSVIDLSLNGCCIRSPIAVPEGNRLAIHPLGAKHANDTVFVRVKWQQQSGDNYLLGCEFTQKSSHDKLLAYAASPSTARKPGTGTSSLFSQTFLNVSQAGVSLVRNALARSSKSAAK